VESKAMEETWLIFYIKIFEIYCSKEHFWETAVFLRRKLNPLKHKAQGKLCLNA